MERWPSSSSTCKKTHNPTKLDPSLHRMMVRPFRSEARLLPRDQFATAFTIARDQATSAVFGMPREAVLGAVDKVLRLDRIALSLAVEKLSGLSSRVAGEFPPCSPLKCSASSPLRF